MKIIGVVGSRRRNTCFDKQLVGEAFAKIYEPGDGITSGGCEEGADSFVEGIVKSYNISKELVFIHRPEWSVYGRRAGLERNTLIARDADVLIACVASDRKGGTEDTIRKFKKMGKTNIILVESKIDEFKVV